MRCFNGVVLCDDVSLLMFHVNIIYAVFYLVIRHHVVVDVRGYNVRNHNHGGKHVTCIFSYLISVKVWFVCNVHNL